MAGKPRRLEPFSGTTLAASNLASTVEDLVKYTRSSSVEARRSAQILKGTTLADAGVQGFSRTEERLGPGWGTFGATARRERQWRPVRATALRSRSCR
jgi:hypothetical protein